MMKNPTKFIALLSGAALFAGSAFAGTAPASVATDPVGYVTNTVAIAGEAVVSPVLHRAAVFSGVISEISDSDTLVVSGSPAWDADVFIGEGSQHYALITSGDREGMWALISGNGSDVLDLTFVNEDLGSVVDDQVEVGDQLQIVPFWTLATLFPESDVPADTQVLLFDRSEAGINKSAVATFTMFSGFGWYNGPNDGANELVYPDESVVIRAPAGVKYDFVQSGVVPMVKFRTVVKTLSTGVAQDVRMTTGVPSPVALSDLINPGLIAEGDQVLIFDNDEAGINKSAIITATYFDGFGWYNGPDNVNSHLIEPGQGFIYRKSSTNDSDLLIDFQPSYQVTVD